MELTLCLLVVAGLFWIRRYLRKATSNAPDNHPRRLARIRNASLVFQIFIGISYLFVLYWVLAFLMGWPFFAEPKVRIVISHSHIYTAPADMPPIILTLYLLKTALGLWGAAVLFALFRLYGQGILFTARNVRHLRFLGYWLMLGWAIDYQMQSSLRDMDLSTTPVLVGLMILFVAWIMDEGRKLQEEQALTV